MPKPNQHKLNVRFLDTIRRSYQRFVNSHPRSNEKIKVLHGWVVEEMERYLGTEYEIRGMTDRKDRINREESVEGAYYNKKVDVAVSRNGETLGVISIKFVMNNYYQNKNNYFEQQLGETANLRSNNIAFGHIMVFTQPIPYLKKDKSIDRFDSINDEVINRYQQLAKEHQHPHVPDVQCIAVFLLDVEKKEIIRQCLRGDLPEITGESFEILDDQLSINRFFDIMTAQIESVYQQRR